MLAMSEPDGVDWGGVERVVALCQHAQAVLPETKSALKGALRSADVRRVLVTLTVLDSVAINTNRDVRTQLASKGWMRLLSSLAVEASPVALAAAQLLSNWKLVFTGEELGAAAYSACRALQARADSVVPAPTHFAYQMREIVEQNIPMIALQRGTDFYASYLPGAASPASAAGERLHQSPPSGHHDGGSARRSSVTLQAVREAAPAAQYSPPVGQVKARAVEMQEGAARLWQCVERGQLAEAAGWAECCRDWRKDIRACIAEDVPDDAALASLLEANDALNAALRAWQSAQEHSNGAGSALLSPAGPAATSAGAAASSTPYQPVEAHTQWYSPLGSSLGGQSPAPPPGTPGSSAEGAVGLGQATASAGPTPQTSTPDWLVRGPAPLIDLLSWSEPEPSPVAPAPMPLSPPPSAAAGPGSTLSATPASAGMAALAPASVVMAALAQEGPASSRARDAGGAEFERSGPASASIPTSSQPAEPAGRQAAGEGVAPAWQAFSDDAGQTDSGVAGGSGAAALAHEAQVQRPGEREEELGSSLFPGFAPGGSAWAGISSRKAAAAQAGQESGSGRAGAAAPDTLRAQGAAEVAPGRPPARRGAVAAPGVERMGQAGAMRLGGAQDAGREQRPGDAGVARHDAQEAELQRLRELLRERDAEVARLRAELQQQVRRGAPAAHRVSAPALGPPAARPAGAAGGARRSASEPSPAPPMQLPELATLAYHRQPALRVRFQPGQLEEVAARLQGQLAARRRRTQDGSTSKG